MKKITIDCIDISSPEDFHRRIAEEMAFPEDYGENLDALFDCLTSHRTDLELIFNGWHPLSYSLKDYGEKILYVFRCAAEENPHLTFTLHP